MASLTVWEGQRRGLRCGYSHVMGSIRLPVLAGKSDGSLDNQSVMVRARCIAHLNNLQKRFPALAVGNILETPNHDYRYRLVIPKASWTAIIGELAQEQEWSNFKNETAKYQGKSGRGYRAQ